MNARHTACFVLALVSASLAVPSKRSTDEVATPSLSDFITEAERHLSDFASAFQNLLNPVTRDDTLNKIGENVTAQTQAFTTRVQALVANLNEAVQSGQTNNAFKEAADRLNNTVRELVGEQTVADAEHASNQLSQRLRNALDTVVEEASKISRTVDTDTAPLREELNKATRSAVNEALNFADTLRQQIEQTVNNIQTA